VQRRSIGSRAKLDNAARNSVRDEGVPSLSSANGSHETGVMRGLSLLFTVGRDRQNSEDSTRSTLLLDDLSRRFGVLVGGLVTTKPRRPNPQIPDLPGASRQSFRREASIRMTVKWPARAGTDHPPAMRVATRIPEDQDSLHTFSRGSRSRVSMRRGALGAWPSGQFGCGNRSSMM